MYTEQLTQELALADQVSPTNAAAGTYNSTGLDMSKFSRALFLVQIGAITGSGTLNASLQSCAQSNFGSNVHTITNSAITQVTNANPNNLASLEVVDATVQQQNPGDRYVRVQVVVATNNVLFGAIGLGGEAEQKPANAQNITAVYSQTTV